MTEPRRIDLDARRAAEAEHEAPPVFVLDGIEYAMPRALPASAMWKLQAASSGDISDLDALLSLFFGDKSSEILDKLSIEELMWLVRGDTLWSLYGIDVGNSPDSANSSTPTS